MCICKCACVWKLQLRRVVRGSERRKVMRLDHRVKINESSFTSHDVNDVVECDLSAVDLRVISDQERWHWRKKQRSPRKRANQLMGRIIMTRARMWCIQSLWGNASKRNRKQVHRALDISHSLQNSWKVLAEFLLNVVSECRKIVGKVITYISLVCALKDRINVTRLESC